MCSSDPELIGKYVVLYDCVSYSGHILLFDKTDVEVESMHRSNTKYETNIFYWLDKVRDICFYPCNQAISLIPEPIQVSNYGRLTNVYNIDSIIWHVCEQFHHKHAN